MRTLIVLIAATAALLVASPAASAAVCADYATQAEAQAAADTRDGDGDGVSQTMFTRQPKPMVPWALRVSYMWSERRGCVGLATEVPRMAARGGG